MLLRDAGPLQDADPCSQIEHADQVGRDRHAGTAAACRAARARCRTDCRLGRPTRRRRRLPSGSSDLASLRRRCRRAHPPTVPGLLAFDIA